MSKAPKYWIDDYFHDDISVRISFLHMGKYFSSRLRESHDPKWNNGNVEFPVDPKPEFIYKGKLYCILVTISYWLLLSTGSDRFHGDCLGCTGREVGRTWVFLDELFTPIVR